jgi:hypothetical protein
MREVVCALLESMEGWPWFEQVGEPIDQPGVIMKSRGGISFWEGIWGRQSTRRRVLEPFLGPGTVPRSRFGPVACFRCRDPLL